LPGARNLPEIPQTSDRRRSPALPACFGSQQAGFIHIEFRSAAAAQAAPAVKAVLCAIHRDGPDRQNGIGQGAEAPAAVALAGAA
jgi:hypothetical protein